MKRKKFTLALTVCAMSMFAQAQKEENVWIFGMAGGMGLDFNTGSPARGIAPPASFDSYEATASVCDPATGNLLFYTDGDTLYNKNGIPMPNGRALTGVTSVTSATPTSSGSQGALIVPMPGQPDQYYVFSLTDMNSYVYGKIIFPGFFADQSGFLYYSVVDMSLNGGLGDVVAGKKGIPIDTTTHFTEHMIGVAGNSCNVWVVLLDPQKETTNISRFKSFNVTATGVETTPVISNVFSASQSLAPYNTQIGFFQIAGNLCISPDRKKLALAVSSSFTKQKLALFDFDAGSGIVSNPLLLDTAYTTEPDNQYYGVCFSPDNSKLYANDWGHLGANKIYQFDISSNNANTIIGTRMTISESSNFVSGIKRGPDNKLYYFYSPEWIGVIRNPDLPGMACNPDTTAIPMPMETGKNFPNDVPVVIIPDPKYTAVDTTICSGTGNLSPLVPINTTSAHTWNNGATDPTLTVEQSGTYWVRYQENSCQTHVDTFHVNLVQLDPVITIKVFELGTTAPYTTYQWMMNGNIIAGATDSIYQVTENGDYQVIVGDDAGCTDTSDIYEVRNTAIGGVNGIAGDIKVYPNPSGGEVYITAPVTVQLMITDLSGKRITIPKGTSRISVRDLAPGIYLLHIADSNGALIKVEKITRAAN